MLAATGRIEQQLDEKLDILLTSVVEGNREVVTRFESLTRVITKVREGVERTESKVDQVTYLLTQEFADVKQLLESIRVGGARLPNFVMQNERLIAEAHSTPVMLRERQSNRHRLFAGRAAEIERIHDFLSSQSSGYIFVTGASGYGKTALLANFVAPHRASYIWYFLNQLDVTNNRRDFLRQMCEQMLLKPDACVQPI